jgi:hypothetical protein
VKKESITVRCDGNGCKTIADVETLQHYPADWYHIKKVTADGKIQPNTGFDFCSLKCVHNWSKARAEVLGEPIVARSRNPVGVRDKNRECPKCHEMFYPQGFALHVAHCKG